MLRLLKITISLLFVSTVTVGQYYAPLKNISCERDVIVYGSKVFRIKPDQFSKTSCIAILYQSPEYLKKDKGKKLRKKYKKKSGGGLIQIYLEGETIGSVAPENLTLEFKYDKQKRTGKVVKKDKIFTIKLSDKVYRKSKPMQIGNKWANNGYLLVPFNLPNNFIINVANSSNGYNYSFQVIK